MWILCYYRYMYIVHPVQYKLTVTKTVVKRAIILSWIVSFFYPSASLVFEMRREDSIGLPSEDVQRLRAGNKMDAVTYWYFEQTRCIAGSPSRPDTAIVGVLLLLPVIVTAVLYGHISAFIVCRKQINSATTNSRKMKNAKAVARVMVIVCTFMLAYIPILLFTVLRTLVQDDRVKYTYLLVALLMPVINSDLDTLIYVYRYPEAQKCVRTLCGMVCSNKVDLVNVSGSEPNTVATCRTYNEADLHRSHDVCFNVSAESVIMEQSDLENHRAKRSTLTSHV